MDGLFLFFLFLFFYFRYQSITQHSCIGFCKVEACSSIGLNCNFPWLWPDGKLSAKPQPKMTAGVFKEKGRLHCDLIFFFPALIINITITESSLLPLWKVIFSCIEGVGNFKNKLGCKLVLWFFYIHSSATKSLRWKDLRFENTFKVYTEYLHTFYCMWNTMHYAVIN